MEKSPEKSNKRKSANDLILSQGDSVMLPSRTRAQSQSQSQPPSPLPPKSPGKQGFTVPQLKEILKDNDVPFESKATKPQLLNLYNELLYSKNEDPDASTPAYDDTTSINQVSAEYSGTISPPTNTVYSNARTCHRIRRFQAKTTICHRIRRFRHKISPLPKIHMTRP